MLVREFCHKILPHILNANISLLDRNGKHIHYYVTARKELMRYWENEVLDYSVYKDEDSDELWVDITINAIKG
jgi:hypothetical protein